MIGHEMWVYHENQESALCARHCLNNLLQGPFFTEFELAALAQQLDQEERELLISSDPSMVAYFASNPESNNVSPDGNFSVQVLRRGLQNMGLELIQVGSSSAPEAQEHPEQETAFICNLDAHWFAVRKIFGTWYDLNSLSGLPETAAIPTLISDFFLSAFLSTLRQEGYSIFAVRGSFPHPTSDPTIDIRGTNAKWHRATEVKSRAETYPPELLAQVNRSLAGKSNFGGGSDSQLQAAIRASLGGADAPAGGGFGFGGGMGSGFGGGFGAGEDAQIQAAIAASLSGPAPSTSAFANSSASAMGASTDSMDMDDELQRALAMSMQEDPPQEVNEPETGAVEDANVDDDEDAEMEDVQVPEEPVEGTERTCTLAIVLPSGTNLQRQFLLDNQLKHVSAFVRSVDASLTGVLKYSSPPTMRGVDDEERTLESICDELASRRLRLRVSSS